MAGLAPAKTRYDEAIPAAASNLRSPRDQLEALVALAKRTLRRWWVIAAFAGIGMGASVWIALNGNNLYLSETVILYREMIKSEVLYGEQQMTDRENAATRLKEVVLARPRLQSVIDEMDLYPEVVRERGYVAAVEKLRSRIEFKAKGGDIFHISFRGESPDQAYQVTQYLAESLIEEEARARAEEVTATKGFLDDELTKAERELREREIAVAKFLARYPEFGLETYSQNSVGASVRAREKKQPVAVASSSSRRSRPTDATLRRLETQADRIRALLKESGNTASSELRREKELADASLEDARNDLNDTLTRFTDKHPDALAAKSRVTAAERRVRRAKQAINEATRPRPDSGEAELKKQLDEIERQVDARRSKLRKGAIQPTPLPEVAAGATAVVGDDDLLPEDTAIVDLETDWTRLNREVEEARERYDLIESKHFRASIDANSQLATQSTQMSVIDPAYVPIRPAGRGKKLVVIAGTAAAGMIGFALALLLALMDDRFWNRRDVERLELMDVLVVIPPGRRRGLIGRVFGRRRAA